MCNLGSLLFKTVPTISNVGGQFSAQNVQQITPLGKILGAGLQGLSGGLQQQPQPKGVFPSFTVQQPMEEAGSAGPVTGSLLSQGYQGFLSPQDEILKRLMQQSGGMMRF